MYRTEVRCCIPLSFQGVLTGSYTRYVFPSSPALHGFESDRVPREIVVQVCAFEVPPRCWCSLIVACRYSRVQPGAQPLNAVTSTSNCAVLRSFVRS